MKISEEVYIHGYIDEIRKDTVIIRNGGGYFGTVLSEIKSLEQPCEDCVSRQTVIDEINSMSNANPSYWNHCDVVDREDLIDYITALPPVTPTRKIGKWIELEDFDCSDRGEYLVKCSICDSCNGYSKSDYCPNCGAEMRGSENDI